MLGINNPKCISSLKILQFAVSMKCPPFPSHLNMSCLVVFIKEQTAMLGFVRLKLSRLYPVPRKNLTFFPNIIGLPEHRNKRKSILEITKTWHYDV